MKENNRQSEDRPGRGRLIFVVDDEILLLDLARHILEADGFKVQTYRDPSQALLAHHRAPDKPAMILTDFQMKNMNGLELTAACRQIAPRMKIALVSGTVDSSALHEADEQPDGFLAKPYGHRELLRLVHDVLN